MQGPGRATELSAHMADFAIDPELRIRAKPERVLRRTNDAVSFIREIVLSRRGQHWRSILQRFEAIRDELDRDGGRRPP